MFYTYNSYLQKTFGAKTYKVVVGSGLTCPTRDGTLAKRGCAFCDLRGSSSFYGKKGRGASVAEQIESRLPGIRERFGARKFLAYFQSYTNTYSPELRQDAEATKYDVENLRELYESALSHPEIEGLAIGTRPDCLPDAVLELLEEIAAKRYVSLELGIQSFENKTLEWLERGHDARSSIDALERLRARAPHIRTCAHFIFGSPTDSPTAARDAALILNDHDVQGAKLHQLMILDHTILAERYRESPFPTLSLEEYAERVLDFVEHLSPGIYLERLCATATHKEECLAPEWSRDRWNPHNRLREILASRGVVQGNQYSRQKGV